VFPEVESPTLVPEEIDEETPLPVAEVTEIAVKTTMIEHVAVSEHSSLANISRSIRRSGAFVRATRRLRRPEL
jgi:hypothetical protein